MLSLNYSNVEHFQEHFNEKMARRIFIVMHISRCSRRVNPMVNTVALLSLELDTDAFVSSKDLLSSRIRRECVECGLPISWVFLHYIVE
jgi:hypothetical protein